MGQLAQATQGQQLQAAPAPTHTIQDIIKSQWSKIEAVMPKHMSSERLYQITISAINHEPKLMQCDVATLLSCVMKCSALGLEPSSVDGLGRAYILPFNNKKARKMEATFILGYKGMIELARRSGQIKDLSARAVYDGDYFKYEFGLNENLVHRPSGKKREAAEKPTHVYMVAHFTDGGHYMDVMTYEEIEEVRKRSAAASYGPWVTDWVAMALKTVIRRSFKFLPVSIEAQEAVEGDETSGGFTAQLDALVVSDTPVEHVAEEVPIQGETHEPAGLCTAVCKSCGNVNEFITADALIEDVNASAVCCETPDYEFTTNTKEA